MSNSDALQQFIQVSQYNAMRSDETRQMELLRYWADELARPRHADAKRLPCYGFKVYSQCDEDGILQKIFNRVGATNRTFVEFGVEAGQQCNTVKLLVEGWHDLWLEASSAFVAQIRMNFRAFLDNRKLTVNETFVTAENINSLHEQGEWPSAGSGLVVLQ